MVQCCRVYGAEQLAELNAEHEDLLVMMTEQVCHMSSHSAFCRPCATLHRYRPFSPIHVPVADDVWGCGPLTPQDYKIEELEGALLAIGGEAAVDAARKAADARIDKLYEEPEPV